MMHSPATDRQQVEQFLRTISYDAIRAVDRPHDVRLPDGRILRGIQLDDDIYLARDRKFYINVNGRAEELSLNDMLAVLPDIQVLFLRLAGAPAKAKARRKAYRRRRAS